MTFSWWCVLIINFRICRFVYDDCQRCDLQVGFRTTRFYWSHRVLYKRCRYLCSITENQGAPEFVICVQEEGHPDVTYRDTSAKGQSVLLFMVVVGVG